MERAGDNAHGADDGRGVGTNRVENVYYQEPAIEWHDLDGEILRRVIDNDAGVAGLRIGEMPPHLVSEGGWRRVEGGGWIEDGEGWMVEGGWWLDIYLFFLKRKAEQITAQRANQAAEG